MLHGQSGSLGQRMSWKSSLYLGRGHTDPVWVRDRAQFVLPAAEEQHHYFDHLDLNISTGYTSLHFDRHGLNCKCQAFSRLYYILIYHSIV